jgi:hypothetical protein
LNHKKIAHLTAAVLLAALVLLQSDVPGVHAQASVKAAAIRDFRWLAGDWETTIGKASVDEHWSFPAGGIMMGMSRTVANGKTVSFEYLRLEQRPDGIFYVAHPQARPGTDFKLDSWDGKQAVFVNPGHADHLKKIVYRLNSDGTITARIEGENDGKPFAQEWQYKRSAPAS